MDIRKLDLPDLYTNCFKAAGVKNAWRYTSTPIRHKGVMLS